MWLLGFRETTKERVEDACICFLFCSNILTQTWIQLTYIYDLTFLEVRSPEWGLLAKIRVLAELPSSGGSMEGSVSLAFQLVKATCPPWHLLTSSEHMAPTSASIVTSPSLAQTLPLSFDKDPMITLHLLEKILYLSPHL